jgi:hypothetical protein
MLEAHYLGPTPCEPPLPPDTCKKKSNSESRSQEKNGKKLDKKEKAEVSWADVVFASDEADENSMGTELLLRDPYEACRCSVRRSTLCDTTREGLAPDNSAGLRPHSHPPTHAHTQRRHGLRVACVTRLK